VDKPIHVLIINGSVRPNNYTAMASALVADELKKDPRIAVEIVNPGELGLPMPGADPGAAATKKLQEKVKNATAIVLATPEYHGSFSSVMKLVIENLGFPSALAGKPVALLGVAAGAIGAIKSLEHLRGVVSHVGAIALPLPVSVANVQSVFDKDGHVLDAATEKLIRSVATRG
jgi:chromate reductase, NAD(P)H dehydrogenase (quinone)